MKAALLLWLLATVDAACAGYRAAAGRNALINKTAYYRRALLRGALYGQIAVALAGLPFFVLYRLYPALWPAMHEAAWRMLWVYAPYALLLSLAFAVRLYPSVDWRSITSTVIFGPFTLLRPLVAVAGLAWGIQANVKLLGPGLLILTLMLSAEWILSRWLKRRGLF